MLRYNPLRPPKTSLRPPGRVRTAHEQAVRAIATKKAELGVSRTNSESHQAMYDIARRLGIVGELERRALEEYKLGHLTKPELRRLLGFGTRDALDGFLKARDLFEPYTLDDLEHDRQDLRRVGF